MFTTFLPTKTKRVFVAPAGLAAFLLQAALAPMEWSVRLPRHRCHDHTMLVLIRNHRKYMTKPRENKFAHWSEAEWIQPPHQEKEASPNKAWRGHIFQLFTLMHQRLPVEQWRKTLVDWLCVEDIYRGLYNLVYWDFVGPNKSTMDNKPGCITNWIFTIYMYIYIYIYWTNSIATEPGTGQDSG